MSEPTPTGYIQISGSISEDEYKQIVQWQKTTAMTAPTPAQIDAALEAFHKVEHSDGLPARMSAAITAAAEVARQGRVANWGHPAAAEVGEPEDWIKKRADIRASAIERCAQVVEEHDRHAWSTSPATLAAAIRALKDK